MAGSKIESLFSGKIYCGICGWKYRVKTERNKKVYICSKYSTGKNGGCERHKVDEQHLKSLIEQQLNIYQLPLDRFDLVETIVIARENIKIYYNEYAPTYQTKNLTSFGRVGQQPEKPHFGRGDF